MHKLLLLTLFLGLCTCVVVTLLTACAKEQQLHELRSIHRT